MIGVLALQGAFQKHLDCLKLIGEECAPIKHEHELKRCNGLIIPGGETTAHIKLLGKSFWNALAGFGQEKPVFGTCCGLILLASRVQGESTPSLKLMDITVARNAYGTQLDSFEDRLKVKLGNQEELIQGCFIRAPKIVEIGKKVQVLACHDNDPVIVEEGHLLAATFHPEISLDTTLHQYFASKCKSFC